MISIYLLTEETPLVENDFAITVHSFMGLKEWSFGVNRNHTIGHLKRALKMLCIEADPLEMSLIVGLDHPYSLRDEIYLHELREEHRTLHVIVNENPKKVIPKRLITYNTEHKKILDLREMREDDFQYISYNWIVTYNFDGARGVVLSSTHSLFDRTLKEIARDIDNSLNVEERPEYPLHYFIDGVGESDYDQAVFIQDHTETLYYFYRKLNPYRNFRRIRLYLGSFDSNAKLITKEWVKQISPELSEIMWEYN